MRFLRNQMIHEYIEDPAILHNAILTGHYFVPKLIESANNMIVCVQPSHLVKPGQNHHA